MSAMPFRALRGLVLGAALAVLASPVPSLAQKPPDLLDGVKKTTEIQAQKMESEVRDALAEAQRLSGSDPARAVERLKKTLSLLEADRALTPARRDLLTRQIRDRLKTAEVEAERFARKTSETNQKLAGTDARTKDAQQRAAEAEQINRTLDVINQLQREGKTGEAARVAEDLFRRHPNLAAPQVVGRTTSVMDQVAYLRGLRTDAEKGRIGALNTVERSAVASGSDFEFPKDWEKKVAMRNAITQSHMTTKEKQIMSSLGKSIDVNYDKIGFFDVIEDLSTKLGQPILLDKAALADAGVSSETAVSLRIKGITARTALRKILGDLGLAYIIKNETIQVVTEKTARETMVTRTYYLGSLLAGGPFSDAGIRFVPGLSQFEATQNVLSIVQLIQTSVEPQSWQANGGPGSITFHAPTMSLIIRNSAEVHGMLGGYVR